MAKSLAKSLLLEIATQLTMHCAFGRFRFIYFSLRFSATLRCAKLMPAEIQRTDSLVTEAMAKKFDNESFENPL